MADLSEADKRTLLGENYKEVLEKAQAEGRVQSAPKQLWASEVEKCKNSKFSAIAVMVVGAILFVSNLLAISGPSVLLISVFGIAAFVLGAGWYLRNWSILRTLLANHPDD